MKRKNGKKSLFTGGALALALALLMTIGLLPAVPAQAAVNVENMKITYQLDNITSVGKGMPFGATFYFDFSQCDDIAPSGAKVTVSAAGVALSKKTFELEELPENIDPSLFPNSSEVRSLYIPEQYMTNTGRSVATLKFTITWEDTSGNETYRAYGQKTITECQLDEGATSEPVEEKSSLMVENYSVNKENLREGNTFDLAVTIRNNGQKTCNNVNVMLPTLDRITVNGKLNVQARSRRDGDRHLPDDLRRLHADGQRQRADLRFLRRGDGKDDERFRLCHRHGGRPGRSRFKRNAGDEARGDSGEL